MSHLSHYMLKAFLRRLPRVMKFPHSWKRKATFYASKEDWAVLKEVAKANGVEAGALVSMLWADVCRSIRVDGDPLTGLPISKMKPVLEDLV